MRAPGAGDVQLMTKWGEKVSPDNAWREYPRPQMVRSNWRNLNGLWEYAITSNAAYVSACPWDGATPCKEVLQRGEILVPFAVETPLSGVGRQLTPTDLLWYRRSIPVQKRPGERIILHFGAVDYRCQVFIGHAEVTDIPHDGGSVPFSVDITDYVVDGENELILCVWDPTEQGIGSHGKQVFRPRSCLYSRMSGVWQTVWMESVPEDHIRGYRVVTDIDKSTVRLEFDVSSRGGQVVVDVEGVPGSFRSRDGRGPVATVEMTIPDARLWSPESPYLYAFTARYGSDSVRGYFGMRKIEKRRDARGVWRFFLNNSPYYVLGVLDQGWWPDGFLTPPAEGAIVYELETLKRLGLNCIRKHMKVEPARYYHLCDKLGFLVLQDMPPGSGDRMVRHEAYRRELKSIVDALQPVPSVVMWVPYNEDWGCQPGEFFTHNTLDWVRRYDPTRLVDGPSGWRDYDGGDMSPSKRGVTQHKPTTRCEAGDAVDMHIYRGPDMPPINERRVSFLGEFGGLGQKVRGHLYNEEKSWGYPGEADTATPEGLNKAYLGLMDKLGDLAYRGLGGSIYTQTSDVELEVNGYFTYDRKVLKFDEGALRTAHLRVLEKAMLGATGADAPSAVTERKVRSDKNDAGIEAL